MIMNLTEKALVEELFASVSTEERCPYIRKDKIGAFCANGLEGDFVPENSARRIACDPLSLQLWCLDKLRCDKCIFYNLKPFNQTYSPLLS
ncbi:MAG: hypothetical protein AABX17_04090 [Nanoarchaeota archaeon]